MLLLKHFFVVGWFRCFVVFFLFICFQEKGGWLIASVPQGKKEKTPNPETFKCEVCWFFSPTYKNPLILVPLPFPMKILKLWKLILCQEISVTIFSQKGSVAGKKT